MRVVRERVVRGGLFVWVVSERMFRGVRLFVWVKRVVRGGGCMRGRRGVGGERRVVCVGGE